MRSDEEIRAEFGGPELATLWTRAREAIDAGKTTFRLELPDDAARQAVGDLAGRPMWGEGTRLAVSKLDESLRERCGRGLSDVLDALNVTASDHTGTPQRESTPDPLHTALAEHGLDAESWAQPWVAWVHQYGRVAEEELEHLARASAAVLARLALDPASPPRRWCGRADLAARCGLEESTLDSGRTVPRLVLRAAALSHNVDIPGNDRERVALWRRCGVVADETAATSLCWALPLSGEEAPNRPVHLTHSDLARTSDPLVAPGTVVAVCRQPRVVEAAARRGTQHPLVCTTETPSTAVWELLHRLSEAGARLLVHTDLDLHGLDLARWLLALPGTQPWRLSSDDYRQAVDTAAAHRVDLPVLTGQVGSTPWDRDLPALMSAAGRGVGEEIVLTSLLEDLDAEN